MSALIILLITAFVSSFAALVFSFLALGRPAPQIRRRRSYAVLLVARLATVGVLVALVWFWRYPSEVLFVLMAFNLFKSAVVFLGPAMVTALISANLLLDADELEIDRRMEDFEHNRPSA